MSWFMLVFLAWLLIMPPFPLSTVPVWTRNYMGSIHSPPVPSIFHSKWEVVKAPLYPKTWPGVLAFLLTRVRTGQVGVSSLQAGPPGLPLLHRYCSHRQDPLLGRTVELRVHTENSLKNLLHCSSVSKSFKNVDNFFCVGLLSFLQYPWQILLTRLSLIAKVAGSLGGQHDHWKCLPHTEPESASS